ncbi:hypothetical protein ACFQJ7_01340 [Halovenus rubra]|uniref:Zinc ribbon domain-containing protein n=2 Tax=Halovenus rubra TaxID=869890 RepID=A0ABD5X2E1_9EURY|nr:hypothetical protein [Halovenus rubra]
MEWRCEWCGKPHEEDDPPCDNCGHGKFEKAVVRQTDLSDEDGQEATLVWACTDCGREHPKHAPPCSRCGNPTLEKQKQRVAESELDAPGYFDLVTPQYLVAFGLTLVVVAVAVLGFTGVIDVPGFDQGGVPDVDGVPGNATAADGIALDAVETTSATALNEQFTDHRLRRSTQLDDVATRYTQRVIKSLYADGERLTGQQISSLASDACQSGTRLHATTVRVSANDGETAEKLGAALAEKIVTDRGLELTAETDALGLDAHSVRGDIYLGLISCNGR